MKAPAALLAVSLACTPAAGFELEKGPYLQDVTSTSVTVVWETSDHASAHVRFGTDADLARRTPDTVAGRHHEVTLEGLGRGRRYTYALYTGDEARTETFDFRTAPAPGVPFRFVVYGDNRSDHAGHAAVVGAILAEPGLAFAMNTGDMVSSGEVEAQWTRFFEIERALVARLPVYPTLGNHEAHGADVSIWERIFVAPRSGSGTERYYAFTYGSARFVVADGHVEVEPWYLCLLQLKPFDACFTAEQDRFLQRALRQAAADPTIDHIFMVTHVGPYSSKTGRTGSAQMRWLEPVLAEVGVRLVLSGHDHYYQHGLSGNGIHYIVSGGGGAPLYVVSPSPANALFPHQPIQSAAVHHYVVVDVGADRVEVTTKSLDGEIIERFVVDDRPRCARPVDCQAGLPGACDGSWACTDGGTCAWVCDPPPACVTPDDCPDPPEGFCPGAWRCTLGACDWACDAGECASDLDCAGREPLNDCLDGRFQCADEVCEWFCPAPRDDADGTGTTADAGPAEASTDADGTQGPADAAVQDAARAEDAGRRAVDEVPAPSGLVAPDEGCNCRADRGTPSGGAALSLLALLALVRRSNRFGRRSPAAARRAPR